MNFYITVRQPIRYHQMTLDEFLFGIDSKITVLNSTENNTRVYEVPYIPEKYRNLVDHERLIGLFKAFVEKYGHIISDDMSGNYRIFKIPKSSGGLRTISAPQDELKDAQNELKHILEDECGMLYHTSAFAYIHGRSTIDAVKRHQRNESNWFAKFDLHDFFGSINKEYLMKILNRLYPTCILMEYEDGFEAISKSMDVAFLNGGLPQGSPLSPLLTNIIMIPFDYRISSGFRKLVVDGKETPCVYTRYADDFLVSSRYKFPVSECVKLIHSVIEEFGAPFELNAKKTRFGSRAGANWNLGIMLNKDNQMTIGHKNKKLFQAMLHSYAMSKMNGEPWEIGDVQELAGKMSYYKMIEKETIEGIVHKMSMKLRFDIMTSIRNDLKGVGRL